MHTLVARLAMRTLVTRQATHNSDPPGHTHLLLDDDMLGRKQHLERWPSR